MCQVFAALGDWIWCELYTCNLIMLWNLVFLDERRSTEKWPVYVFHVNQCDVDGNKPRSVPALMDLINVANVTCVQYPVPRPPLRLTFVSRLA